MAQGISLHIGINTVDPKQYKDGNGNPWDGKLNACENDAKAMQKIADSEDFDSNILLTRNATHTNVIKGIRVASRKLQSGDIFFLSYSGHGSQAWDFSGDEPSNEAASTVGDNVPDMAAGAKDETFCFYNRFFRDDEMNKYLGEFKSGVRIIVVSDCCHSGTIVKQVGRDDSQEEEQLVARQIPFDEAQNIIKANKVTYKAAWNDTGKAKSSLKASVLLLSACKDSQLSNELKGAKNGVFTQALLDVWSNGNFKGNYKQLQQATIKKIPAKYKQTPSYFTDGAANKAFEQQQPFTI